MRKIEIYEVGPRDGFPNVNEYIPLETKIQIIDGLIDAGLKHVQITSFVSPKAIPQMKDARDLALACVEKYPDTDLFALVPNLRGAQGAWDSGLKKVSYVVSLSESHNRANIRRTHDESFAELEKILQALPELDVCIDLATTFGCPFEGKKWPEEVVSFLKPYVDSGVGSVDLCDTVGLANPAQVRETIDAVRSTYPELDLQVHIHDTRNMGMVNTLAAIEQGVYKVQSTLGGLGGCPYAPGASGNLATEDLVYMLADMGYETGIDVSGLIDL
jgi:hydroxymethylglutaryl-CoA lyase